ncbi:MAG: ABC transporter ATP-binding protein [Pirellulales bacterium]|nr:ABC transporter ATP-binding protein [Pirellulales bacterium]
MPAESGIIDSIRTPPTWRERVCSRLEPGEEVLAYFEPDLNSALDFGAGMVVLTRQRVLCFYESEAPANGSTQALPSAFQPHPNSAEAQGPTNAAICLPGEKSWLLQDLAEVRPADSGGLGSLELLGHTALLETWYYTGGRTSAAERFVQAFRQAKQAEQNGGALPTQSAARVVCPSCGSQIEPPKTLCDACTPTASPPPVRSLWRLARFAQSRATMIAFGFSLTLASTGAGLVPPYLTGSLIDDVLNPRQSGADVSFGVVPWYLVGMMVAYFAAWLLAWAKTYVLASVSEQVSADLRNETYAHLQRLSLEFFGGKRTGDLIARVGSDTDRICNFLSVNLLDFGTDVLMIALTATTLLCIDVPMGLVAMLPFPFIAWMAQRVRIKLRHGFARTSAAWAEMVNVLADTIPGIRVVKAFAQENREIERFRRRNQHVLEANIRVNVLWSFFAPIVTLLTDCGTLVIWGYGAWRVFQHNELSVGVLVMFITYMGRLYVRLDSMSRFVAATQRAAASTQRIFEILDRRASVPDPSRPVHPGRLEGKIELKEVSFKYGTRIVTREVNLAIEPGEMIGLVGPSGSGKSTLVNLICRFYDVTSGAILVDGTDIRSFPIEEYRANIGIVLQEPFLFYGTIAENIAYGRPEATPGEIVAAARAARAHEFIVKLTDGYDSLVGERGQSLSGGERQRISIARAILTDPRILILDEATSSVDTETEREIQEALTNLIEGRTTLAIAHRLSTLRSADRLVVLDQGVVVAIGRHDELVESCEIYARLHQANLEMAERIGA